MGELAAAIAHEINQPLSAAGTYTGLVAESLQTETLRDPTTVQTAAKAAAQISRAADVVRRLKTLVRLGRCDAAPTSLGLIVHEAVDVARTDLKRRNIAFNVELPNDLPPVLADRLQIEQVLLNLIRNSMESIGTASLGLRRDKDCGFAEATAVCRTECQRHRPRLSLQLYEWDADTPFDNQGRRFGNWALTLPLNCRSAWRPLDDPERPGWSHRRDLAADRGDH